MEPTFANALSNGADATTILMGVWVVGGAVIGATSIGLFAFRKARRMSKNLSRPFAIVGSTDDKMAYEKQLLDSTKFFKPISLLDGDHRAADLIDSDYRLVVLRYEADSDHFWSVYEKLQSKQMPVIVYAKPSEIKNEDIQRVQKYLHHTLCNTPVRLLSDVWAIMSTYPEGGV
jgi:FlaA1/EpsC-like NDP-sugar epimerase